MHTTHATKTQIKAAQLRLDAINDEMDEVRASDRSEGVKALMLRNLDRARYAAWAALTALETGKRPAAFV